MSQSYLRLKMFIKINKIILHVSKSFKTITTKLYINTCIKYIVIFMKMLYESKLLRIQMLIKINQPITLKNFFLNQCSPTNALLVVAGQAFSSNFKGIALSISAIYY